MGYEDYGAVGSRYYDPAYARLERGDVAFYGDLARESGGPVLELGCGTGRVLLPIAQSGITATGLDFTAAMLDVLRGKHPPPTLRLVTGSMTAFDLGGDRFPLIFSAFRAFQHLYTLDDQLACLGCVRRHLTPAGRFAFDVFAPDLARTAVTEEPEEEDARFEHDGVTVVRRVAVTRDLGTQMMEVRMRFTRSRGGAVVGEERQTFRMRWFHRYELEHLLARAGFAVEHLYGGFDRRAYDGRGEVVIVARAAG